jgi:hypothetical protein
MGISNLVADRPEQMALAEGSINHPAKPAAFRLIRRVEPAMPKTNKARFITSQLRVDTTVNEPTQTTMTCTELAQRIERTQPHASPQDVARLCLLLSNSVDDLTTLRDARALNAAWKRTGLQLQVATDQHAAMTQELEELAASDPQEFDRNQIWILIRAIKVQSQVLQMYVGHPLLDV